MAALKEFQLKSEPRDHRPRFHELARPNQYQLCLTGQGIGGSGSHTILTELKHFALKGERVGVLRRLSDWVLPAWEWPRDASSNPINRASPSQRKLHSAGADGANPGKHQLPETFATLAGAPAKQLTLAGKKSESKPFKIG